jgi:hypothetical protein
VLLASTAGTAALILVASIQRRRELARGSETLAQSIGARAVAESPRTPPSGSSATSSRKWRFASGGSPARAVRARRRDGHQRVRRRERARAVSSSSRAARWTGLQRDEMQALVAYGSASCATATRRSTCS